MWSVSALTLPPEFARGGVEMNVFNPKNFGFVAIGIAVAMMLGAPADARRGRSIGSRGARTHQAPPPTAVAPNQTAPVQQSMTGKQNANLAAGQQPPARKPAPARSGGMAKGLIGGLIAGGLIGALMGGGLRSLAGAGLVTALLQAALIGGLIWLLFRVFRRRSPHSVPDGPSMQAGFAAAGPGSNASGFNSFSGVPANSPDYAIEIYDEDKQAFERLLVEVQDAYGKEDYARLRERTTPEIMSFFAEELGQNASNGRRNQVSDTRLIDAEVAEAWQEGSMDYATIAMRYESIDVMVDRSSGAVIEGDPHHPTQATELWTFVREEGGAWYLSAVQET
jgi:predicted lipid-binding transport protein (Tim44 family)